MIFCGHLLVRTLENMTSNLSGGFSKDFKQNPGDIPPSNPQDAIGALYCALVSVALHLRPGHVTRWCGWELGAGGKETHVARLSLTVLVGRLHSTNITITLTMTNPPGSLYSNLFTLKCPKGANEGSL